MKTANQLIADYAILAETSYATFNNSSFDKKNEIILAIQSIDPETGEETRPESFAEYVTKHYNVVAHYADRVENTWFDTGNTVTDFKKATAKESGFFATLFQANNNADNAGEYVLAIRGTAGFKDLAADVGDIVGDGIAYEQVVDLYNFYKQLTTEQGKTYQAAVITLATDINQRYNDAKHKLLQAIQDANY